MRRQSPAQKYPSLSGLVIKTRRRKYWINPNGQADNETIVCHLKGRTLLPVCGDHIHFIRDGVEGVIESIAPRTSLFYRSDVWKQKLIAANVTQVLGVIAPGIALDEMLLNRWIVAAKAAGCRFILVVNKSDLPEFKELRLRLEAYVHLGVHIAETSAVKNDTQNLVPFLDRERSLLIGQSGMGKSTLVNALIPEACAATKEVSDALDSGRHTTSAATLYPLPTPKQGWIIDSPGMRVFGLAHLSFDELTRAFVDIAPYAAQCQFHDCRHLQEPGCAVQEAVKTGRIHPKRLQLFHELIRERKEAESEQRMGKR